MGEKGQRLDDPKRLADLAEPSIPELSESGGFERFVRLASRMLEAPVSLVTLVTANEQRFVSSCGLPEPWSSEGRTPLSHSFCQHVVTTGKPLVVECAREDERVRGNRAVDDLGVEAYLGVPILSEDGNVLGSFCVIGDEPREWTDEDEAFMRDLSESVASEIALVRRTNRLEEANEELRLARAKNEELVQLLVHDLKNPLSGIQGGVDLLHLMEDLPAEVKEIRSIIEESCQGMMDMIGEILEGDKLESSGGILKLSSFNVETMCRDLTRQVGMFSQSRSVDLNYRVEDGVASWVGERRMLKRMIHNLLINAIRYTPQGGKVDLVADLEEDENMIKFSVIDDGPGVPQDEREKIFKKFEVGRASNSGSMGLGLHFCKMAAEAHGGTISVSDGPGKRGSVFSVLLPFPEDENN